MKLQLDGRFLTPAEVRITGKNKAELTKDGKKLLLAGTSWGQNGNEDLVN